MHTKAEGLARRGVEIADSSREVALRTGAWECSTPRSPVVISGPGRGHSR